MWYRTDKKNKIRKNGDTRGYLFFYRTFFIVIIYTVDWRADLRTHRSKVNAGTIAGPTLCLSIAKQGSPNETDASFRTNDPASTSLSPSSQGADFPPTTSLEARGGKTQKKWEPEKRYRPWWEDCREVSGKQSNICLFLSCPCSCRTKNEQKGNISKKRGGATLRIPAHTYGTRKAASILSPEAKDTSSVNLVMFSRMHLNIMDIFRWCTPFKQDHDLWWGRRYAWFSFAKHLSHLQILSNPTAVTDKSQQIFFWLGFRRACISW